MVHVVTGKDFFSGKQNDFALALKAHVLHVKFHKCGVLDMPQERKEEIRNKW